MGKKILMVIASKGYRDEELDVPKNVFEKNGMDVIVASTNIEKATGKLGGFIKPDVLVEKVISVEYDAVVFVGGPGADEYFQNGEAHRIAREMDELKKFVCAICIAPVILGNAGILKGRKATVFPSGSDQIKSSGAIYTQEPVTVDGYIVTADGPDSAEDFAETIIKLLG